MSFEVDPDSFRLADQQLSRVAEDTDMALTVFEADAARLGEPWGADDLGSMIGEIYRGAHAMVMNCITSNLDTMDQFAERLSLVADRYEETDRQAEQAMRRLRDQLGGSGVGG